MTAIDWLPWGAEAFARARTERKPVLLSLVTTWCRGCEEMDRTSYADPVAAGIIRGGFVPVRVDADRRPDISSRYTLGGWPTTAFLNADGDLLGGGTFVPVDRLAGVLHRVLRATRATSLATPGDAGLAAGAPDCANQAGAAGIGVDGNVGPLPIDQFVAQVFDGYDADHGAFGPLPRFPHTAPVHLALDLFRERSDPHWGDVATTCLDAMGWGGLYDEVDGGFFRYARGADWSCPQSEKLLDVNAALLSLYLDAFETLHLARYAERAEHLLGYVQQTMADPHDGGWAASQQEDPGYYSLDDPQTRNARPAPAVDRTLFAGANAAMASAALRAARVFGDDGLRNFALKSLERIALRHYRPGAGVAHCVEAGPPSEEVRGLLDDQIAMASAHIDAYEVTEDIVHEMMAEEVTQQAMAACRDAAGGAFFDRALTEHDFGLLRRRLKPFVGNCEAARMLRRLAVVSGNSEYAACADQTLRTVAPHGSSQGPLAAHYILAVRESPRR